MKLVKPPWVPKRLTGQWREVFEALRRGRAQLSDYDSAYELAIAHQLCAPLASYALERGDEVPERWRTRLNHVRAQNLIFETCLASLAEQLDALNVRWFVTRGAARLADPLVPDRLCGDVDLYILPKDWPTIEIELAAKPDFERTVHRGEKNRSTRHFLWRPSLEVELDFHLSVSPFHSEGGVGYELLMQRRVRNAHGLWVLPPEDDYGMALIEALIEAPANRLRRLWELDALYERLKPGELQRMRRHFGLRRWAHRLPHLVFRRIQGTLVMNSARQLLVRYGGLSMLILASRRPLRQTRDSIGLMLRRFRA